MFRFLVFPGLYFQNSQSSEQPTGANYTLQVSLINSKINFQIWDKPLRT
jgi:hypothetical protein